MSTPWNDESAARPRSQTVPPTPTVAATIGAVGLLAGAGVTRAATLLPGVSLGRLGSVSVLELLVGCAVVGGALGLVGRSRRRWTVLGVAVLTVLATVPVLATLPGVAAVLVGGAVAASVDVLLLRAARRVPRRSQEQDEVAETPALDGGAARARPVRRRVLVIGGAVAVGIGALGLAVPAASADPDYARRRRRRRRGRGGGQGGGQGGRPGEPTTTAPTTTTTTAGSSSAPTPTSGVPRASGSPLLRGRVVDVRDHGATGDGSTDDGPALQAAIADANRDGGTVHLPAATYVVRSGVPLRPVRGTTVAGDPGRTTIRFDGARGGAGEFLEAADTGVTVDGLIIERVSDFSTVVVSVRGARNFTLSRTSIVGHSDQFDGNYCHGFLLGADDGTPTTGLTIAQCTFETMDYGLLQTNASRATTTGVRVHDCTFAGGNATDLEFNNPRGRMSDVVVENNTHQDNDSDGFAVGFANVSNAVVRNSRVTNYALEAVHVEDYSSSITIQGNAFTDCGQPEHAHVQIISSASGVQVLGNTFDASQDDQRIFCVNGLPAGVGSTESGRPIVAPSDVTVDGNHMTLAASVGAVFFAGVTGGRITGNTIDGAGAGGNMLIKAPDRVFDVEGGSVTVSGNVIGGRRF